MLARLDVFHDFVKLAWSKLKLYPLARDFHTASGTNACMAYGGISIDRVTITPLTAPIDETGERALAERFRRYVAGARKWHAITLDDETFEPQSLSLILRLSCIVHDAGGRIALVTAAPRTLSVLSATRMDRVLGVFPHVEAAIAHLSPHAGRLSA